MYEVLNDVFFTEFEKPQKTKIFYGGSGSGKSLSIAQYFILKLISGDGKRRAIFRKSFPFMKLTTYLVLKSIIQDWGLPVNENKTDHYFEYGDNRLYYLSLDESEKIKGGEFKEVWLEETTEFTEDDYKQLRLRLSRDKFSEDVSIILSFNPIDENHWCIKLLNRAINDNHKYISHHSTYHDNETNLSQSFINELEDLINTDENFYNIYCLGIPGVLKNKIYSHFKIEDSDAWNWNNLKDALHFYGLDFGFNHPIALSEIWYHEDEFYVKELYYKREKTTDDLAVWMHLNNVSHTDYIFADNAEPDRINMLCTSKKVSSSEKDDDLSIYVPAFNCHPAKKDVKAGIDFIKGKKIHLCSKAVNGIKEYNNYKYKEDKNGNVFEEPVKAFDDFLDSLRYGIFTASVTFGLTGDSAYEEEYKSDDVGYGYEPHTQENYIEY